MSTGVAADPLSSWTAAERAARTAMEADPLAIVVVHMRAMPNLVTWAKSIGRYQRIDRQTSWGNPFVIGVDGTRDEVIAKYRAHLATQPALLQALGSLRGKSLGCWCAPASCHGDVLREMAS